MMRAAPAQVAPGKATSSEPARLLGLATLGLSLAVAALQAKRSLAARHAGTPILRSNLPAISQGASSKAASAARGVHGAAALLALSVLADSALEHYRGRFQNPGMAAPLLISLLALLTGSRAGLGHEPGPRGTARLPYLGALGAGLAGTGFHLYNIFKRPGSLSWGNLFYAAPLGAPAALSLVGLLGLAASRLQSQAERPVPTWLGLPAWRSLAAVTGLGIAGTSAEATLFHFRGAFQNPFMWLPVTLPPVASLLLLRQAIRPARSGRLERAWLGLTALLGIGGTGFHAYGVGRQMGGWRNWSQNLLSGPPLPAPPSFSALALAGMAALSLNGQDQAGQLP